jgi:predicted nucleotidyltransferase
LCVKHDILATLSYFDIFDYPLNQTEIFQFSKNPSTQKEITESLQQLAMEGWVFKFDEFYSLQDNYSLIMRRRQGNARARDLLKKAEKIAAFLSAFPFVRGVAVSGSLSKNFADENSDIDFFIITSRNTLWLARTIMHCFKKFTYLTKKQHFFCMNYYISEAMLEIKEKNIFTATEVVTLLPLRGIEAFRKFFIANKWSNNLLPNHTLRVSYVEEAKNPLSKKIGELLLNHPPGRLLDILLMKYTAYRWTKKTKSKKLNMRGIVMGMDTSRHYAKPLAESFQQKLILIYEKKIFNLFRRYESKTRTSQQD